VTQPEGYNVLQGELYKGERNQNRGSIPPSLPPHQLEQITCSHDNPQVMPNSTLIYLYLPPSSSKSKLTNIGRQRETKIDNKKKCFESTS